MNYQTDLMRSILLSKTGQRIIDYISPLYGESYVGLWLLEVIGSALDEVYDLATVLRYEASPATSELLQDYWLEHYGIAKDSTLTEEQKREKLIAKTQSRGSCNPSKMATAISAALGGAEVEITENVGPNTFLVNIRDVVEDVTPVVAVIEKMKPAHLVYQVRVATQMIAETDIKAMIAMTHAEMYKVEVQQ